MTAASTTADSTGDSSSPGLARSLRSLDIAQLRRRHGVKWSKPGTDYAAWVADMDFPVADAISTRLRDVIQRQEFGYPGWLTATSPAVGAFADRMERRYGWAPDRARWYDTADVLQGVQVAIEALSQPGDGIVLHLPAYYPFIDTAATMRRPIVPVLPDAGEYRAGQIRFDYDALERQLAETPARIWILCHPHNPLGHVFTPEELGRIAEIAERYDLFVISDEIHADLRFGDAQHIPFATVADPARVVTVSSASKAFNLAGLRWAVLHAGPERLVDWLAGYPGHMFGAPNVMAVEAATVALSECDAWLAAVLDVLDENRLALTDLLAEHLPGARYRPPDATYLAWVDVSDCGLGADPHEVFRSRGVEVSPGPQFGSPGVGHVRINLATSPDILAAMVAAMGGTTG